MLALKLGRVQLDFHLQSQYRLVMRFPNPKGETNVGLPLALALHHRTDAAAVNQPAALGVHRLDLVLLL